MAVTFDYQYAGLTIANAYVRVDHIAGSKDSGWGATVGVYADSTHTHNPVAVFYKDFPYAEGSVPHTQAYDAIKADYPTATDC